MQTVKANPNKVQISENLLNIDSIFGFCFADIDHNKQLQQIVCDHGVGHISGIGPQTRNLEPFFIAY